MMRQRLQEILDKLEALRPREKILLLGTFLVVILLLWDGLVNAPQGKAQRQRNDQLRTLETEVKGYDSALKTLEDESKRQGDPMEVARKEMEATEKQIRELDEQVKSMTASGVLDPPQMSQALSEVISLNRRMTLVSMRNLKSEPLVVATEDVNLLGRADSTPEAQAADATAPPPPRVATAQVYRHSVELVLEGSYLETLDYVAALENLPVRLIWNELRLSTVAYPKIRVRLVISTLSLQTGLVGV